MAETEAGKKGVMTKWIKMVDASDEIAQGIKLAGTDDNGELNVTILLRGRNEIRLNFNFETIEELATILKLNARS